MTNHSPIFFLQSTDPLALAAEMNKGRAPPAAPTHIALEEEQHRQPLHRSVDPHLPSVSAFVSRPPPPPTTTHHDTAEAPQPQPPPQRQPQIHEAAFGAAGGGSGSSSNGNPAAIAGSGTGDGVGCDAAAQALALDSEIAKLEEELEGLGLTKQREMLLKRELAMKRAERSRRRTSLG